MQFSDKLVIIQNKITEACRASGRNLDAVTLVAVCKKQHPQTIIAAHYAGLHIFGENTLQGLNAANALLLSNGSMAGERPLAKPSWHFIGKIQRNKVKALLSYGALLHSVDRAPLLDKIVAVSEGMNEALTEKNQYYLKPIEILLQVNIGAEPQKGGVSIAELDQMVNLVLEKGTVLRCRGLMGVPPKNTDPERYFTRLRALFDEINSRYHELKLDTLSMGMSADYETAIRCGSTLVRIGTALFGERITKHRD